MTANNRWTEADSDEAADMVLTLCQAVADELKRDDVAPADWRLSTVSPQGCALLLSTGERVDT